MAVLTKPAVPSLLAAFAALPRPLNISSIRSVTTNPPTMFAVASTTATRPRVN